MILREIGEIEDKRELMTPTVEWMARKYDEMNQTLFGGELGACSFKIFTTGKGSQGGVLGWFRITTNSIRYRLTCYATILAYVHGISGISLKHSLQRQIFL